jgi:hypothetical protein
MALNDIERKRCERDLEKFMERHRPPPDIRPKLDFGYRVSGHSVELFDSPRLAESEGNDGTSCRKGDVCANEESMASVLEAPGSQVAWIRA